MKTSIKLKSFKSIAVLLFLFFFTSFAIAQKKVTGIVTDKKNAPISGVRILVVDTDAEAKTENDGKYTIIIPEGFNVLRFAKNGYKDQDVAVNSDVINVTMASSEFENLSIDELMLLNLSIVSKKSESSFDAPLSSTVITKQDIKNAGATSIPDALRLIPGFIVREVTNGVYDAHIRGFDYLVNSVLSYSSNNLTLVMIDGRPVFRDFQGGTYWESLPIGLNDVDRIEVIRGPSSSMYGANAASGVINIITKRFHTENKNDEYVYADMQRGNFGTTIGGVNAGVKKNKISFGVSSNFQKRDRFENSYYDFSRNAYVNSIDSVRGAYLKYAYTKDKNIRFPNTSLANDLYGINSFVNYAVNKDINFDMSFGLQKSLVQKVFVDISYNPYTMEQSETEYANFKAKIYGLNILASHLTGYQNSLGIRGWEYNFYNNDISVDYDINLFENKLNIRPGFNYRSTLYNDSLSNRTFGRGSGLINNKEALLSTYAGLVRLDYSPTKKLRFISSVRLDKYNYPNKTNLSYQFAATFKPNNNNLIRFAASRANKGPIILDNYFNFNLFNLNYLLTNGNTNLSLTTIDMYELGYRAKLFKKVHADLELFYLEGKNFTAHSMLDSITPGPPPFNITQYLSPHNLSMKPTQRGMTLSITYNPNEKLQFKPFGTWQKTTIYNYAPIIDKQDSTITKTNDWTPTFYYGFSMNYLASTKLNINASLYGFSQIYFKHYYGNKGSATIRDQVLLNLKTSYQIIKNCAVYVNIRNFNLASQIKNDKYKSYANRQFGFTDDIKTLVLFGINVDL